MHEGLILQGFLCVCVLSVMMVEVLLLVRGSCGQHRTGLGGATASWA